MICPKAEGCTRTCSVPNNTDHKYPHEFRLTCSKASDDCPACIEVPEPYIQVCPMCEQDLPIGYPLLIVEDNKPAGLYKLPDKETTRNPFVSPAGIRIDAEIFKAGVDAVYAQAKPVDIDDLAEKWLRELHGITGIDVPIAMKFSEFINEYMEGK